MILIFKFFVEHNKIVEFVQATNQKDSSPTIFVAGFAYPNLTGAKFAVKASSVRSHVNAIRRRNEFFYLDVADDAQSRSSHSTSHDLALVSRQIFKELDLVA